MSASAPITGTMADSSAPGRWCIGAVVLGTPEERAHLVDFLTNILEAEQTVRPSNHCHPDEFALADALCIEPGEQASVVRWVFNTEPEIESWATSNWCVPASTEEQLPPQGTWGAMRIRHWLAELASLRPSGVAALFAISGESMSRTPTVLWMDSPEWPEQANHLEAILNNQRLQETYRRSGASLVQTARDWREVITDGAFIPSAVWAGIQNNLNDTESMEWVVTQRRRQHLENILPADAPIRSGFRF